MKALPKDDIADLRKAVRKDFGVTISVDKVSLPLVFMDLKSGLERTPYLLMSKSNNTITLCPDYEEDSDFNFLIYDYCGYFNFEDEGAVDMGKLLREYI